MGDNFTTRLAALPGAVCAAVDAVEFETPPTDSIYAIGTLVHFEDRTKLSAQFWRLIQGRSSVVSSFDHRQQYGLPAPVDAIGMLREALIGRAVVDASMDEVTGDLRFDFAGDLVLEVFNFTAFEIWEITFPDGTGELSNYALAPLHGDDAPDA